MYEHKGAILSVMGRFEEALENHLLAYKIFQAGDFSYSMNYNKGAMKTIFEYNLKRKGFDKWLSNQLVE